MDIDRINFKLHLLDILQDIAGAKFVTIDLEMSGINTTLLGPGSAKKSLQDVYEGIKEGAEKFQILQWGLTCVEEDLERGYYRAKPYNIYVSPLISHVSKRYCEDRVFGFSSEACGFLLKNGLDFGKVFSRGIPYLSQLEEAGIRENFQERENKRSDKEDLVLESKMDIEFYQKTKQDIQQWEENPSAKLFHNIRNPSGALNGYQRRMIYQLVRNEFPHIEVFQGCHGEFLQLRKLSQEERMKRLEAEENRFHKSIVEQRGLRYLFNALTGDDLTGIDPEWYCNNKSKTYEEDLKQTELKIKRIIKALKDKKHIIVGHNIFTDLLFLHRSFVGWLPSTISHFKQNIRFLFPIIIDTRFLATYNMDSMTPSANLKDLLFPFKKIVVPTILLDDKHRSYNISTDKDHEAGFDSWMTAELFLKASAKLYTELIQQGQVIDVSENPIHDDYRLASQDDLFHNSRGDSPVMNLYSGSESSMKPGHSKGVTRQAKQRIRAKVDKSEVTATLDAVVSSTEHSFQCSRDDPPGAFYSLQLNSSSPPDPDQISHQRCTMLPQADNLFWKIYANKLRVTASKEGVLALSDDSI
ncbi:ribonuclease H-like domain-containing protein [Xylogone sp. PMI_703]|nr:ribonuclease H-like domain-containing protein [Xylogone sp. PMI_703]